MNDLLIKGYAKRSDMSPSEKHGTFQTTVFTTQASQEKFDCSAEFEDRSINKELLSGPDLTNQIVGVLTCF